MLYCLHFPRRQLPSVRLAFIYTCLNHALAEDLDMTRAVKAMTQGKVHVTSNSFGEQVLLWTGDAALPGKQSTWKIQRRTYHMLHMPPSLNTPEPNFKLQLRTRSAVSRLQRRSVICSCDRPSPSPQWFVASQPGPMRSFLHRPL